MREDELLLIPGPVELPPSVLQAQARPPLSHTGDEFTALFQRVLQDTRWLFDAPDGLPIVVAGSGTLALELGLGNLVGPGDRIVVVETGFFSTRFSDLGRALGAEVTSFAPPVGQAPDPTTLRRAIERVRPSVVTLTHVDTSTGVRIDLKPLVDVIHATGALCVVDGVCSIGGEEFHQQEWDIDVALTGSQKAIAAPPGLALVVFRPNARERALAKSTGRFYADYRAWEPVMESYLEGRPAYFATQAVTLTAALDAAYDHIKREGLDTRVSRHRRLARAFQSGCQAINLRLVPDSTDHTARTLSVIHYPSGVDVGLLKHLRVEGIVAAGGIHPALRTSTFRIGHLGQHNDGTILTALGALERALFRSGYDLQLGAGLAAAQQILIDR